jgi:hypothetical protein
VTSSVLVVLLLGPQGSSQLPIILVAAVAAMVTAVALDGRRERGAPRPGAPAPAAPSPGEHESNT